jgi:Flp pilus assembly pilin Flp
VEYALMVSLIAVAIATSAFTFGSAVATLFASVPPLPGP